jgi:hypothetical protein
MCMYQFTWLLLCFIEKHIFPSESLTFQCESLLFFFGTGAWTQNLYLELLYQPYFCEGFCEIRSLGAICLGWLQSMILLISVSWVARITGMSQVPGFFFFFPRTGAWTQEFMLAWQILYHLNHSASPGFLLWLNQVCTSSVLLFLTMKCTTLEGVWCKIHQ